MLLFLVIYLFAPYQNGAVADYKSYKNYKIYEINGNIDNIQKLITNLTAIAEIPYYEKGRSRAEVLIAPDLVETFSTALEHYDLHKEIIIEDFSKIIEHEKQVYRRSGLPFSWKAYYDVDDIYSFLRNMSNDYPQWTNVVVGGQSYESREILGLRINTPTRTNKKIVFIESGIHAREWITPATTTFFINQLLTSSDPAITALRDKFEWHIFPTINPDGYHYSFNTNRMWRKTRSKSPNGCYGANPNRNWDYNWGRELFYIFFRFTHTPMSKLFKYS
ncbi:zinc carboxypeptidase A 1-like isoform X2 [Plodia interpunctella]|nr:zinc carboxypeptidase A 1-like isoform X2 [Plodia interpunctella]